MPLMLQSLPFGVTVALPLPVLWRTPLASRQPPASQPTSACGPRLKTGALGTDRRGATAGRASVTRGIGSIVSVTARRGMGDLAGAVRHGSTASRVPSLLRAQIGSLAYAARS